VTTDARYDGTTIAFHWLTAGIVLLLWCIGQTIDDFPKGLPRMTARSAHIVTGALLGIIIIARVVWRLRRGRRLPAATPGLVGRTATAGHRLLYVLLAVTVLLGIANTWVRPSVEPTPIASPEGQVNFNKYKGATPMRTDVKDQLDTAGQLSLDGLVNARVLMPGHANDAWDMGIATFSMDHDKAALLKVYTDTAP